MDELTLLQAAERLIEHAEDHVAIPRTHAVVRADDVSALYSAVERAREIEAQQADGGQR